ncbi:conserved Plasmodium protein, unknown function [Plasmodium ovale wallikeri]|uniref:Uncharacterized protein n=1 Tax=Plasmodium ovale wallikeri TaxID=864142 RepID=A0A1A8YIH8_PLAOA|nr:conserved Plasmodium protein, unknown function [Plasmodium ovale wallikeri]
MTTNNPIRDKLRHGIELYCKKCLSSIYIIHLLFNILLLNYLLIYLFVIYFYRTNKKNHIKSSGNYSNHEFSKTLEGKHDIDRYDQVTHFVGMVYILFSLSFYVLDFFTKWKYCGVLAGDVFIEGPTARPKHGNNSGESRGGSSANRVIHEKGDGEKRDGEKRDSEKRDGGKGSSAEAHIAGNYIMLYLCLALLGLRTRTISEHVFSYHCVLMICEINTPLTVFMNIIKVTKRYYEDNYLKRGSRIHLGNIIRKRDLFLFFCYFMILRFFKKVSFYYDKYCLNNGQVNYYKKHSKKALKERKEYMNSTGDNHIFPCHFHVKENILANFTQGVIQSLSWYTYKIIFLLILIKTFVTNLMRYSLKLFHIEQLHKVGDKGESLETAGEVGATGATGSAGEIYTAEEVDAATGVDVTMETVCGGEPLKMHADKIHMAPEGDTDDEVPFHGMKRRQYLQIRRNANKYKKFYDHFKNRRMSKENEKKSHSNYHMLTEKTESPLREKRKFHVIEEGSSQFLFSNVDAFELDADIRGKDPSDEKKDEGKTRRHENCSRKVKLNFANIKTKNMNEKSSYISLYFPSVIKTDSEGSSLDDFGNVYGGEDEDTLLEGGYFGDNNAEIAQVNTSNGAESNQSCHLLGEQENNPSNEYAQNGFELGAQERREVAEDAGEEVASEEGEGKYDIPLNMDNGERKDVNASDDGNCFDGGRRGKNESDSHPCMGDDSNTGEEQNDSSTVRGVDIQRTIDYTTRIDEGIKIKSRKCAFKAGKTNHQGEVECYRRVRNVKGQNGNISVREKRGTCFEKNVKLFLSDFKRKMELNGKVAIRPLCHGLAH